MTRQFRRRNFMTLAGAAGSTFFANRLAVFNWASPAQAQEKNWRHGVALFGDLRYPSGFNHFEYVNANTPKGGKVRQAALGTFNNFNVVVAGLKGSLAAGVDFIYETLLVPSLDEVSSDYGLLAEAISYPPDYS